MLSVLMHSDPRWEEPYKQRQRHLDETMILTVDHRGLEGAWAAHGAVSTECEAVFSTLELTLYWQKTYVPPPP